MVAVFDLPPVDIDESGKLTIVGSEALEDARIAVDFDGDGAVDRVLPILSPLTDPLPPVTSHTVTGKPGLNGWYLSDVAVSLSANDADGVGVQGILYSLDDGPFQVYARAEGIPIAIEGTHSLSFYSLDYFGNQETPQTVSIKIDKTAPEASISVDPTTKDLKVVGIDSQSDADVSADAKGDFTLTDEAGHTTKLLFKRTYSGKLLTFAQLTGIQYDGVAPVSLPKATFVYVCKPRSAPPQLLSQTIVVNGSFTIEAVFNPRTNKTTVIVVKKGSVPQKLTFAGQKIVKLKTKSGVLDYEL